MTNYNYCNVHLCGHERLNLRNIIFSSFISATLFIMFLSSMQCDFFFSVFSRTQQKGLQKGTHSNFIAIFFVHLALHTFGEVRKKFSGVQLHFVCSPSTLGVSFAKWIRKKESHQKQTILNATKKKRKENHLKTLYKTNATTR